MPGFRTSATIGLPVCPHFLMEPHRPPARVQNDKHVEYIPQLDDITTW